PKSETGEALVQPELPELNINDLNKEQKAKEQAQPSTQDIFGQNENKEDKKAEVEKTSVQKTSQTVTKGLKALANTGVSSTATVGLGALVLLSALVLRRKNNK
ncbi:LPXTG cell wall anchor domain-containing protein, partial [Gemella haemolysans]|uniref:LPXTG cell wall anchor domain-containing protein n=1 Tax=Gemella haemolysans TaxID=1379 RepID=UPI0028D475FA